MENSKKNSIIKLYKEVLGCYSSYITRKTESTYAKLYQTIERAKVLKVKLEEDNDADNLVILSMWFIDGEGWLNLEPTDDQVTVAISACLRAIEAKGETMEFMNLDIQYINPEMTVIDKSNVDEFCAGLDEARDELDRAINKVKKETKVDNGPKEETVNETTGDQQTNDQDTNKTKSETESKMSKFKKFGKYALTGVLAGAVIGGIVYGVNKYLNDGVTVLDFE